MPAQSSSQQEPISSRKPRARSAFEQMLDAADDRATGASPADEPSSNAIPPTLSASTPLCSESSGEAMPWSFAYERVDEPSVAPDTSAAPSLADMATIVRADVVAAELDLESIRSAADLHKRRRQFMWDNHPDRRRDMPRGVADRRVAIANMLVDHALKRLR